MQPSNHPDPYGNQGPTPPYGHPYTVPIAPNQNPYMNQGQPHNPELIPIYPVNINNNDPIINPYPNDIPANYNQMNQYNYPYNQPPVQPLGPPGVTYQQGVLIQTDAHGHQNATHFQAIHVDSPIPLFGRNSIKVKCPYCQKEGMTKVKSTTDGGAICLVLLFSLCIICCLFLLCSDAIYKYEHSCSSCNAFIGASNTQQFKTKRHKRH